MQFPQKRYAMDERLPSGKTMAESIDPTMGTGIDTRWLDEKLLDGGGSPTFATPQNVQPMPQIGQISAPSGPAPAQTAQAPNAPTMPNIAPVNDGTIQGNVSNEQISPYDAAKQRYNEKLQVQPKYAAWKEALFLGLQGMAKVFDQNPTPPIRMLKDVRKDYNDQRATAEFAPIAQQYERDQVNAERQKRMQKIDLEEANRVRDDAFRVEKDKREYDLKIKMADWKIEDRQTYWEWEKVKETAKREGKQKDYELAVRKQDEIERNNQVKTDQTERKGMPKNNVPLPPSQAAPSINVGTPAPKGRPKKDPLGIFK